MCSWSVYMRKGIFVFLISVSLFSARTFAEEVSMVVRYGISGQGSYIVNGHANDASGDFGAVLSFEYGMPLYVLGKQHGIKMSIGYLPLVEPKLPVTGGLDVDLLFGYWVRFPFGLSDFAFQPEIDYGIAIKSVNSGGDTVSTMDPKFLLGLSMRWNCLDFAQGNLEFELTPQFGVETSNTGSLYFGGKFGVHLVLGKNIWTDERVADREGKIVDVIQSVIAQEPSLKGNVSVYRSKEGISICLESMNYMRDSWELDDAEFKRLVKIIRVLRKYDYRIMVAGHCAMIVPDEAPEEKNVSTAVAANVDEDSDFDDEYLDGDSDALEIEETVDPDVELSKKRAQVVADYLIERGVRSPSEIIVEGRGSSEPRSDNNTEAGRRKNSRVEIILMRKVGVSR